MRSGLVPSSTKMASSESSTDRNMKVHECIAIGCDGTTFSESSCQVSPKFHNPEAIFPDTRSHDLSSISRPNGPRPRSRSSSPSASRSRPEETFQGPHKWRENLRPVSTPRSLSLNLAEPLSSQQNDDCFEDCEATAGPIPITDHTQNDHSEVKSPSLSPNIQASIEADEDQTPQAPPWKKEFLEKSQHRKMNKQSNQHAGLHPSQIPITARRRGSLHGHTESVFTRQVVNTGLTGPVGRKKLSPSNSFRHSNSNLSANPGRRSSPQVLNDVSTNTDLTKKRIERVQRARLYLLQLTGPNSFLIGGDSPDHKFRVVIGPQTCSCGRGPHCVHVLFVMLRVFKVGENDPCLWSKTLKNYEVENLFRIYHDKRSSRITKRRNSQRRKEILKSETEDVDKPLETPGTSRLPSESDAGSIREEEDTCPICLLEMLEGESLIKCEYGCQNRLHHHCIAIWFEECRRQNDALNCPLCRAQWKTTTVEIKSTQSPVDGPNVPPNTRVSSPQASTEADSGRLPYAEPIPPELQETVAPWIEALGPELVSCLVSRNWSIREEGLKHLSKEVMAVLLKGSGEGRSGVIVSPVRRAATHNMLQTACDLLAFMCADPVYRVFVASLRSVRTLLAYTPCRDKEQQQRLQAILRPVIEAVILKCTDGNRRTSQLSLSTLVELVKGQDGELAVGREIINPGTDGIDGLNYVLKLVTEDYNIESVPWQWLLGRLYIIDRLLEEFPADFVPPPEEESCAAGAAKANVPDADRAAAGPCEGDADSAEAASSINYQRLMSVAHFSVKAVCSSHMRIARMSRRVFLLSAKLGAHVQKVISQLKDLLCQIDSTSVASLGRKLDRIVDDFLLSERIVHQLMHGSGKRGRFDSASNTPIDSPISSPRCSSPVNVFNENNSASSSDRSMPVPCVPPNTPTQRPKRRLKRAIPRRSFRDANQSNAAHPSPSSGANSPERTSDNQKENIPAKNTLQDCTKVTYNTRLGSSSPPTRKRSNLPRRKTIEGDNLSVRGKSTSPTIRRRTVDGSQMNMNFSRESSPLVSPGSSHRSSTSSLPPQNHGPVVPLISITDTSQLPDDEVHEEIHFEPAILSDVDEICRELKEEDEEEVKLAMHSSFPSILNSPLAVSHQRGPLEDIIDDESNTPSSSSSSSSPQKPLSTLPEGAVPPCNICCECKCHEQGMSSADDLIRSPKPGTAGVPNTPESPVKSHYHTSEHESMSSDDFLDFSQEATPHKDEKPVSFKSEVAESPKSSPNHSVHSGASSKSDDCGSCKEEVEREEAEALAKAMEVSERQDPCPVVPGLTPTAREEVITIRIQPDQDGENSPLTSDQSNGPSMYLEKVHWVKGPLIGTGAYSSCYQARDVSTGIIMAVKQISFCRNSPQEQEKVIEAISEEIHMMSRLDHPNVVRILGATKQGCHFNMFVEWMPGGSMAYLLGQYGPFTEQVMVSYTRQLLKGLAYLHDNQILHRDLKGANLLVNSTGQNLRIGDFGASARLASQATGAGEFQGQLLGTIAFMAPEVLRGESYGRACDVWSVGCVMIEMATTKPPWNATDISNHLALIFKIASSVDSPPIPENLAPPIRDLMLRCLEQKSEDRPSAKELLLHPLFTQWIMSRSFGK